MQNISGCAVSCVGSGAPLKGQDPLVMLVPDCELPAGECTRPPMGSLAWAAVTGHTVSSWRRVHAGTDLSPPRKTWVDPSYSAQSIRWLFLAQNIDLMGPEEFLLG